VTIDAEALAECSLCGAITTQPLELTWLEGWMACSNCEIVMPLGVRKCSTPCTGTRLMRAPNFTGSSRRGPVGLAAMLEWARSRSPIPSRLTKTVFATAPADGERKWNG